MSPTPALFSLPEARTRFTVSWGAGVCRSDPALLFLLLSLKICQRPEDLRRSVRSWPLPRLRVRERRISYLFGSRNRVVCVGERGALTPRLAPSAPAAWGRCLGQEPWSLGSRPASYTTRWLIGQPVHASLALLISSRGGYGAPKREMQTDHLGKGCQLERVTSCSFVLACLVKGSWALRKHFDNVYVLE